MLFAKLFLVYINWDSLHARLNSHHEAWSHKKKKHIKVKEYRKSVWKEPTVDLSYISVNSRLEATNIIGQGKAEETVNIDILVTYRNNNRKIMQSTKIMSRPPSRMRKWNQFR